MNAYDYDKYAEADVRRALAHDNRTPEDFSGTAVSGCIAASGENRATARKKPRLFWERCVYVYPYLYYKNYCERYCVYCGFNCHNKIRRAKLNAKKRLIKEMAAIAEQDYGNLILTGEKRNKSDVNISEKHVKIARKYFKVIGLGYPEFR